MDRYIGLDAHSSSCTMVVIGPGGKRLQTQVIETNARVLVEFIRTIPGNRHRCLEEGTHSNWLYEVLSHHFESRSRCLCDPTAAPGSFIRLGIRQFGYGSLEPSSAGGTHAGDGVGEQVGAGFFCEELPCEAALYMHHST